MPLYIEDDRVADLVGELAETLGTTREEAVRTAVQAALDRLAGTSSRLRRRLDDFYAAFPKLEPTGLDADKAFYDALSGEIE